jgi:alkanesulfonate monooxygenase SsuD/methylene tetrahydromethanopterin reductase-like flavin-dependent oxidoreductase (luciferase family)
MRAYLLEQRRQFNTSQEVSGQTSAMQGAARDSMDQGLVYGSPETVCEKLAELQNIGIGGLIIHFRLGPMSWEAAENSLRLFAEKVAPKFR